MIVPAANGITPPPQPTRGYFFDAYLSKAVTDAWLASQRKQLGAGEQPGA
jgi:hypothetical protein